MALSTQTIKAAAVAARAADEKSGSDIVAMDLSNQLILSDVFLLVSGANDRQLKTTFPSFRPGNVEILRLMNYL